MDGEISATAIAVVRKILAEEVAGYADDAALLAVRVDELNLDSLTKLELVLELENTFGVLANETEVAACETIGELIALVSRSRARSKA